MREIRIEGEIAFVPLTKGYEAIIDAADVPLVDGWNWTAMIRLRSDGSVRAVYAKRCEQMGIKQRTVLMHRVISNTPYGFDTDHVSGDGLDNRRVNLRNATKSQNQHNGRSRTNNTSGVKGVSWQSIRAKWQAMITLNGKQRFLGYFNCRTAASFAYAKASAEMHGEFGRTE